MPCSKTTVRLESHPARQCDVNRAQYVFQHGRELVPTLSVHGRACVPGQTDAPKIVPVQDASRISQSSHGRQSQLQGALCAAASIRCASSERAAEGILLVGESLCLRNRRSGPNGNPVALVCSSYLRSSVRSSVSTSALPRSAAACPTSHWPSSLKPMKLLEVVILLRVGWSAVLKGLQMMVRLLLAVKLASAVGLGICWTRRFCLSEPCAFHVRDIARSVFAMPFYTTVRISRATHIHASCQNFSSVRNFSS